MEDFDFSKMASWTVSAADLANDTSGLPTYKTGSAKYYGGVPDYSESPYLNSWDTKSKLSLHEMASDSRLHPRDMAIILSKLDDLEKQIQQRDAGIWGAFIAYMRELGLIDQGIQQQDSTNESKMHEPNRWLIEQHLDKSIPLRKLRDRWLMLRDDEGLPQPGDPRKSMNEVIRIEKKRRKQI